MPRNARLQRMDTALRRPMTHEEFFDWAEAQDGRYEFDGEQPVAMVGGTNDHGTIADNINFHLKLRLRGGPCRPKGAEGGGVATIGKTIRYPDATVTCRRPDGRGRLLPDPVIVFEVISESNELDDRVIKMREYHAVPTIKRYIIVEQTSPVVTSYSRQGDEPWSATALTDGDTLALPEIGIEIPVADIYDDVRFDGPNEAG